MICVFPADAVDFSTNGNGVLTPFTAYVTETLNGEYELQLTHPIDEAGKWKRLVEGCILRAPVPASMTPRVEMAAQEASGGRMIYRVTTNRDPLRLRSGTGTNYKILGKYAKGSRVYVLNKTTSSWYEVTAPDGKHGYMASQYLTYVSTEPPSSPAISGGVVEPKQLREQPFRIYRVVPELDKISVYARHVFYDLMDNMIREYKPSSTATGAAVVQRLSAACLSEHPFTFFSDLDSTAEETEFINVNPVDALMGDEGFIARYGGELQRDWFDVYLVKRVGLDTNVQIRQGKSLLGVSYDVDISNVVTRIMPTGQDKDGNVLYLPELYVDSPHVNDYDHIKWIHMDVSEARENDGKSDKKEKKTGEQCCADMRRAAQAQFDAGCDLPTVTLKVDFVNCAETEEYREYGFLQNIYLGDAVRVIAPRIGIQVSMRMTQYTYDCLLKKYTAMVLGTATDTIEANMISARQLPSGIISGSKLALNSVGTGQLQSGSVGALQVQLAAIQTAHIEDAAITRTKIAEALIDTLNVNAVNAVRADIRRLVAGEITADQLYADLAAIAVAQLTTAHIERADIEWADITRLQAQIADIIDVAARDAKFDFAKVQNLVGSAMNIEKGMGEEIYITNLAANAASIVSATIGDLVLGSDDGKYYRIVVTGDGTIHTNEVTVTAGEIAAGQTNSGQQIVAANANVSRLNGESIFGSYADITEIFTTLLTAGTIRASDAFVASAVIPQLYTTAISALSDDLILSANESIRLMVGDIARQYQSGTRNYIPNSLCLSDAVAASVSYSSAVGSAYVGISRVAAE